MKYIKDTIGDTKDIVLKEVKNNVPISIISKRYDVSISTIYKWIKELREKNNNRNIIIIIIDYLKNSLYL